MLWGESSLRSVRACGRVVCSREAGVQLRVTQSSDGARVAGFAGLQRCGSFAACPVCSARIAEHRRLEIAQAISWWTEVRGGRVALLTMTVRHHEGQALAGLLDGLMGAWGAATGGRGWRESQVEHGSPIVRVIAGQGGSRLSAAMRIPIIRVVEVTHGANGWHPHVHALLFLPPGVTEDDCAEVAGGMFDRWSKHVQALGWQAPSRRRGVDVKLLDRNPADSAEYFAKQVYSVSAETASGMQTKTAKRGNRTPFQILADVVRRGEVDDLDLWREWETASAGRRTVAWSLGLRHLVQLGEEITDAEVVSDDLGGETVAHLTTAEYYDLLAGGEALDLLEAFEAGHDDGMMWLAQWLAARPDDPSLAAEPI